MNREIVIANTKSQTRDKIIADVNTLGELKAILDDKGIDYTNMDFMEGISKTQLLDDDSQLPHDVNYKGKVTNDLVILLTVSNKKIESGAGLRQEAYAKIKDTPGLAQEIKDAYGRNYTQIPTDKLWEVIDKKDSRSEIDNIADSIIADMAGEDYDIDSCHEDNSFDDNGIEDNSSYDDGPTGTERAVVEAILSMIDELVNQDVLTREGLHYLASNL